MKQLLAIALLFGFTLSTSAQGIGWGDLPKKTTRPTRGEILYKDSANFYRLPLDLIMGGSGTSQPGTGTINYDSVQRPLGWFRPEDFGAKGDSTTNDVQAFRDMIAAIPERGGFVWLTAGKTYLINGKVTVNKRVTFKGAGKMDNYANNWGSRILTTSATDTIFHVTTTGCQFDGVAFRSKAANPTASMAIQIDIQQSVWDHPEWGVNVAPGSYTIQECSFDGFWVGVHQRNGMESVITRCFFNGWKQYALWLENRILPDGGDLSVSDCFFYPDRFSLSEASIYHTSGGGLKITGCKFNARPNFKTKHHYWYNYAYGATTVCAIDNNSFENSSNSAIRIFGNNDNYGLITIGSANEYAFYNTGNIYAIDIEQVRGLEISGGVFRLVGSEKALKINNCRDVKVGQLAIWANSTPTPVAITNSTRVSVHRSTYYQTLTGIAPTFDVGVSARASYFLSANGTINMSSLIEGDNGTVVLTQDATGGRTVEWAGVSPVLASGTLSATGSSVTVANWEYQNGQLLVDYKPMAVVAANAANGVPVTFTTVNNIAENPSGTWKAPTPTGANNSYGQTGKASQTLASGTSGRITAIAGGTSGSKSFIFYFTTSNTLATWTSVTPSWGFSVDASGLIYYVANGAGTSTGVTLSGETLVSVYRDGATGQFKLQTSADNGTTWVDRYTFGGTSTAALNIFCDIYYSTTTPGQLVSPKLKQ